ncbi:MAG: 50S ribosomal protein L11 methyltransferase [Acidimicrobiia bacterium]|nr:50S ribosomal protein L11 methyltransferase [Acidimicrobiia bacterium]MDH5289488.1 50S ribosomal protein L11 methyltransferase [Acidimicrobiia bacterium]
MTAPIVAGAADRGEADAVVTAAAELGVAVLTRRAVGRGRWLLELSADPVPEGVTRDGTGYQIGSGDVAGAVAALRRAGFAVLAGPPTEGHVTVWARRNGPSWFAPGACVCFPWSPVDRAGARLTVEIDPGAGFGAGGHPTTLGLLAGLVDPAVVGAPAGPSGLADLGGRRVLDVGCGTGVLAIAAALSGAGPVDALDIAPAALVATRANAVRNRVAGRMELVDADLARCPGPYDLVLANIHAEVLTALAPDLRRLLARPAATRPVPTGGAGRLGAAGPGGTTGGRPAADPAAVLRAAEPGARGERPRPLADPGGQPDREPGPRAPEGPGGVLGVSGLSVAQVSRLEAALAPLRTVHRHHLDDWVTLWLCW